MRTIYIQTVGEYMLNLLFLIMIGGCVSNKKILEEARESIDGSDCLLKLEEKLIANGCKNLEVNRRKHEVLIRCKKVDNQRNNVWDTWWFRLSPSILKIHPDQLKTVEEHTICIDPRFRIEAYPPEKTK